MVNTTPEHTMNITTTATENADTAATANTTFDVAVDGAVVASLVTTGFGDYRIAGIDGASPRSFFTTGGQRAVNTRIAKYLTATLG